MLAPVSEADAGERALMLLGIESARRWRTFAGELLDATGIDPGLREHGTLIVARDGDEAAALERELALRDRMSLETRRLLPSEARELEPGLVPSLRAAAEIPGDRCADPRALCQALVLAAERAGVVLLEGAEVFRIVVEGDRAAGVELADGRRITAGDVVIAAGAWSGLLDGLPEGARVPVRPVKGQSLRLRDPDHDPAQPLLERVVRYEGGYLVPRGDGRYVLGATVEERGFDTTMTALGVYELLRDAAELVPGLLELELEEAIAGLRPGTPDNAPALGRSSALPGLVWATGHYRNGILLAPVTGDLLAGVLAGDGDIPAAFDPNRFAGVRA
ncbi:unannotated protein [freshwater metagenome]|uniref:Unannotated protein n=1 Tax=freshwater metagenome TaxID=449393 RepID=A0A6J7CX60_9ZZZZ